MAVTWKSNPNLKTGRRPEIGCTPGPGCSGGSTRAPRAGAARLAVGAPLAVIALALSGASAPSLFSEAERWQDDPIWNDGNAEIDVYKASEIKDGARRDFVAHFIVVAEDLRNDTFVKTDEPSPPGGSTRVLKMNQVFDIRTGIYSFRQMASVHLRLADLALLKETVTSHEWCGNTYLHLVNRDGMLSYRGFSYFDGEAERSQEIESPAATTSYDALPLALRALSFAPSSKADLTLVPRLVGNHARPLKLIPATATVTGEETVSTGIGKIEAWKVDVTLPEGVDHFWFEKSRPNRMLRWERAEGGRYALDNSKRLAYWTMNHAGDEKVLEEGTVHRRPPAAKGPTGSTRR